MRARIDTNTKEGAVVALKAMGLSISEAIRLLLVHGVFHTKLDGDSRVIWTVICNIVARGISVASSGDWPQPPRDRLGDQRLTAGRSSLAGRVCGRVVRPGAGIGRPQTRWSSSTYANW